MRPRVLPGNWQSWAFPPAAREWSHGTSGIRSRGAMAGSRQSVFACAALQLCRTRFALRAVVAAPRVARDLDAAGSPPSLALRSSYAGTLRPSDCRGCATRSPRFRCGRESVFACAALQLRRTRFALRAVVAAPRVARRAKRGGRTRDRTLDLSRVKGTLSR